MNGCSVHLLWALQTHSVHCMGKLHTVPDEDMGRAWIDTKTSSQRTHIINLNNIKLPLGLSPRDREQIHWDRCWDRWWEGGDSSHYTPTWTCCAHSLHTQNTNHTVVNLPCRLFSYKPKLLENYTGKALCPGLKINTHHLPNAGRFCHLWVSMSISITDKQVPKSPQ
jgi:hypothetical protein